MRKFKEWKKWNWDVRPIWQKRLVTGIVGFAIGAIFGGYVL